MAETVALFTIARRQSRNLINEIHTNDDIKTTLNLAEKDLSVLI